MIPSNARLVICRYTIEQFIVRGYRLINTVFFHEQSRSLRVFNRLKQRIKQQGWKEEWWREAEMNRTHECSLIKRIMVLCERCSKLVNVPLHSRDNRLDRIVQGIMSKTNSAMKLCKSIFMLNFILLSSNLAIFSFNLLTRLFLFISNFSASTHITLIKRSYLKSISINFRFSYKIRIIC